MPKPKDENFDVVPAGSGCAPPPSRPARSTALIPPTPPAAPPPGAGRPGWYFADDQQTCTAACENIYRLTCDPAHVRSWACWRTRTVHGLVAVFDEALQNQRYNLDPEMTGYDCAGADGIDDFKASSTVNYNAAVIPGIFPGYNKGTTATNRCFYGDLDAGATRTTAT